MLRCCVLCEVYGVLLLTQPSLSSFSFLSPSGILDHPTLVLRLGELAACCELDDPPALSELIHWYKTHYTNQKTLNKMSQVDPGLARAVQTRGKSTADLHELDRLGT
jgi:hypothetical protein